MTRFVQSLVAVVALFSLLPSAHAQIIAQGSQPFAQPEGFYSGVISFTVYAASDPMNPAPGGPGQLTYVYTTTNDAASFLSIAGFSFELPAGSVAAAGSVDDGNPATPPPSEVFDDSANGVVRWSWAVSTGLIAPGGGSDPVFVISSHTPGTVSDNAWGNKGEFAFALTSTFVGPTVPPANVCEVRTNYGEFGCSGTFQASSLADLATYVATDFGRNGGNNYENLKIMEDLSGAALDIESPCTITLNNDVELSGDFVSLDGRQGVHDDNGYGIQAQTACVLSELGNAGLGSGSVVDATDLTVQGAKNAKVGQNATVTLFGALEVISTGDFSSSVAIVKSGAEVTAASVLVQASRGAHLGQNTLVSASGAIVLESTGDASSSDAGIKKGGEATGGSIAIRASRTAMVGQNTLVVANGDLTVTSTAAASGSLATVKSGADVTVGGDASVTSGNKVNFGQNSDVNVTGNLNGDAQTAAKCKVTSSANIAAGSTSGNCF